jgi:hypothetical protein
MPGTRLYSALLGVSVHCNQAELWTIAKKPFKIIEQRPMNVSAHVDPIVDRGFQAAQCFIDVLYSHCIIFDADAIFGNENRYTGIRRCITDRAAKCRRVKFLPNLTYKRAGRRPRFPITLRV